MEISQELALRMADAIRAYASEDNSFIKSDRSIYAELCAIVAELPAPVDPDLVEARKIAAQTAFERNIISFDEAEQIMAGEDDSHSGVIAVRRGIKRGRELAALARSAQS